MGVLTNATLHLISFHIPDVFLDCSFDIKLPANVIIALLSAPANLLGLSVCPDF